MEAVFLVVHLMVALAIIIVVMIQPAESGGFVGGGNMTGMSAPRRSVDTLTRVTTILAGIFFLTSLSLAIIAEHTAPKKGILEIANDTAKTSAVSKTTKAKTKVKAKKKTKPLAPISK